LRTTEPRQQGRRNSPPFFCFEKRSLSDRPAEQRQFNFFGYGQSIRIACERLEMRKLAAVRRHISIACLLLAWLCANGALWNVVQVVAWVKMFHDYSSTMPTAEALELTFDASKPCKLCCLAKSAEDTARKQLPHDAALGGGTEKLLLISECTPVVIVPAPDFAWPGVVDDTGLIRTEAVPVPPPRV
jgi:hypothetical protein